TPLLPHIHARRINEIAAVEHRGRNPHEKAQRLFWFAYIAESEVLLEGHVARHENQQCGPHPDWGHGYRGNTLGRARGKGLFADFEREKIEPVDIGVDAVEKRVEVPRRHS